MYKLKKITRLNKSRVKCYQIYNDKLVIKTISDFVARLRCRVLIIKMGRDSRAIDAEIANLCSATRAARANSSRAAKGRIFRTSISTLALDKIIICGFKALMNREMKSL